MVMGGGVGPFGGSGSAANPGGGLPFAGVPSEMQAGVDLLLSEEPEHGTPNVHFTYRPSPAELDTLFPDARTLAGTILGAGVSYRDEVRRRPWLLFRHLVRLPVPFLSITRWKRSMTRLYWLAAEYRVTCAVFEKT